MMMCHRPIPLARSVRFLCTRAAGDSCCYFTVASSCRFYISVNETGGKKLAQLKLVDVLPKRLSVVISNYPFSYAAAQKF